ncbi:hypothetical protein BGX23_007596 [Mortierella sp. AD031]|nr:hypothetical protein BGX23_007596 [Mortierella sp. AD031]KAG0215449.1 hypothetical protein BGX33_001190 [Mortierella sp. NVP41]
MSNSLSRRSFANGASAEENAKLIANPNASFRLLYWEFASVAMTARELLAYGKADWENEYPSDEDWSQGKVPTPYKVMPVLNVIGPNGKEAVLAETIVIDQYLAKRFNLLGDTEWEEWEIKAHYSSIHYLRERSLMRVTWTWADKRRVALDNFMKTTLPDFIATHEFHLKANGYNGHYVGNRLSLADIHLVNVMDHFSHLPTGELITAEFAKSELFNKVRANVEKNPEIAAWRASEEWKILVQKAIDNYAVTLPPKDDHAAEE